MRATRIRTMFASVIILCSASALGADEGISYGRAGGRVGADRIKYLAGAHPAPGKEAPDQSNWYGRAGGTTGSDRVQQLAAMKFDTTKAYAAGETTSRKVYGRAGVPLPFTN